MDDRKTVELDEYVNRRIAGTVGGFARDRGGHEGFPDAADAAAAAIDAVLQMPASVGMLREILQETRLQRDAEAETLAAYAESLRASAHARREEIAEDASRRTIVRDELLAGRTVERRTFNAIRDRESFIRDLLTQILGMDGASRDQAIRATDTTLFDINPELHIGFAQEIAKAGLGRLIDMGRMLPMLRQML